MNISLLLPRFKRYMQEKSWAFTRKGILLGVIDGLLIGLALGVLLPASVALGSGQPVWGLSFRGWLLVLLVLAIACAALDFFGSKNSYLGGVGFMRDVHHKLGDKIAKLPLGWFDANTAGELSRMVTQEMVNLSSALSAFMLQVYKNGASIIAMLLFCWVWSWRLGLLLTIAIPLMLLITLIARKLIDKGTAITVPCELELASRIVEFSLCQGAIRASNTKTNYPELKNAFENSRKAGKKGLWIASLGNLLNGLAVQLIIVSMIVITGMMAINQTLSPLVAIATIGICLRFGTMIEDFGKGLFSLKERRQLMDGIDKLFDTPEMTVPTTSPQLSKPGSLELCDVSFSYKPGTPVLQHVSFDVQPHTMVALVGPSGCGKTTVARLLSRFYDATEGTVKLGGVDVKDLTTKDLMEQISMVYQDVYLFDDTLLNNIKVGNQHATPQELQRAAQLAGVSEIAQRLPDGWESRVGEGGRSLSGGERQRVSIARALVKEAPIVLFDEATSALDAQNEGHIVESMNQLRERSTLLVIAHKLETIQQADKVVVFSQDGKIVQEGPHDQLVQVDGPYKTYWELRYKAAG